MKLKELLERAEKNDCLDCDAWSVPDEVPHDLC